MLAVTKMRSSVVLGILVLSSLSVLVSIPQEASAYTPHAPILIDGNGEFTVANGVTGGIGTPSDPYIIEGWEINASTAGGIIIQNTDAHFVIRGVYVHSGNPTNVGLDLTNVSDGRVENLISERNYLGIFMSEVRDSVITGCNVSLSNGDGTHITESSNVSVVANSYWSNDRGVALSDSSGIAIDANDFLDNDVGVEVSTPGSSITANSISSFGIGIAISYANDTIVIGNEVTSRFSYGIAVWSSDNVSITANNVSSCRGYGVFLRSSGNVTVATNNLSRNDYGVRIEHAFNVTVKGNNITSSVSFAIHVQYTPFTVIRANSVSNNTDGIALFSSSNATIADNDVFFNTEIGVALTYMTNVTVTANTFLHDGVWLDGDSVPYFNSHTISIDNSVNGKPLRYYKDRSDVVLDGVPVGQLLVANCTGFVGANLTIVDTDAGIEMFFVDDAMIANNSISSNDWGGIVLGFSSNVTFTANKISDNAGSGFLMGASNNVTLTANEITSNGSLGILIYSSGNLSVHHNNFINNSPQAFTVGSPGNSWDDGYPSGGNYWSDYAGVDSFSGPNQDVPGGDGMGDTPYVIDSDNRDRYPLMEPISPPSNLPPVATFSVTPIAGNLSTSFAVDASASTDPEEPTSLEIRWDWEDDGIWDTSWSSMRTAQHQYSAPGDYTIRLEVRDIGGLSNTTTKQLEVIDDVPPVIAHAPHDDVEKGDEIVISANVTDDVGVEAVYLHYKAVGASTFIEVRMTKTTGDTYEATIPAQSEPGTVYYYINASDGTGNEARHPQTGEHSFQVVEKENPPLTDMTPNVIAAVVALVVVAVIIAAILILLKRRKRTIEGGLSAEELKGKEEPGKSPPKSPR